MIRSLIKRRSFARQSRCLIFGTSDENREKYNRSISTTTLKALALSSTVPSVSGFALTFLKISPVITCQALWAAPYPTIKQVVKKKSTEGLPPLPYYSMMANGFLWVVYGCVCDFNPTIIVPNFTGLLCGTYYTMQYAKNSSGLFNLTPYTIGSAALMGKYSVLLGASLALVNIFNKYEKT